MHTQQRNIWCRFYEEDKNERGGDGVGGGGDGDGS